MNKKEVAEIKKQFTPERNVITRICGCYVDGEKDIKFKSKEAFHSISEEEAFKYFDIFRHTLSGTIEKNLINIEFPLEQESEGGTQEFLLKLRDSKLENDDLVDEFYNKIIEFYDYGENYYITLIHSIYDIPGKSSDGIDMFDASDNVYDYILCSICPVKLSKGGLSYDGEANCIGERVRDWVVDAPVKGLLFPVFNDRSTDIHSILYYTKNTNDLHPELIEELIGTSAPPLSANDQKETFNTIISDTLGEECDYEVVKTIHENINELIEENKDEPEPLIFRKGDVKRILENSGVSDEKIQTFDQEFEASAGERASLVAANITGGSKFSIETPDIVIKVNPERTDLVETRIIDGRQCLVIAVDDHIEVNGINVRTTKPLGEQSEMV